MTCCRTVRPARATKKKEDITAAEIFALSNVQQRAEGIKKVGIERLKSELKAQKIDEKPGEYELFTIELEGRQCGERVECRQRRSEKSAG